MFALFHCAKVLQFSPATNYMLYQYLQNGAVTPSILTWSIVFSTET